MTVFEAIARAESLLPGRPVDVGDDPRWQAIIEVGEHITTHPDEVWQFAHHWGSNEQLDLRQAIATCLLEHLLEHHFQYLFPKIEAATRRSSRFADTFCLCAKFGQAREPANSVRFEQLRASCLDADTT